MTRTPIGTPAWGDDLNADLNGIEALAAANGTGMIVASTATLSGPLQVGRHTPVDASGGAKTMSLPTGQAGGSRIGIEKIDSSANAVTITGNMRSLGGQSLALPSQYTGATFIADPAGSWWPVASSFGPDALELVSNVALASNATPASPSQTPIAGSQDTYSRGDHVHPSAGLFSPYGTGLDGDLVFDGTTTVVVQDYAGSGAQNIVPASSVYTITFPIAGRNITLGAGVTLAMGQGCTLYVSDTLICPTGQAVIHADGNAGLANGTAGAARPAQQSPIGAAGGAGNTGAGSQAGAPGGDNQMMISGGGAGGLGPSGAGGGGYGAGVWTNQTNRFQLGRSTEMHFQALVRADRAAASPVYLVGSSGGGGGGGDGTNKGGGGGGGAGVLIVNARRIVGNIVFRANGGNGGSPTTGNAGGGGGGSGGLVLVNTTSSALYTGPSVNGTAATYAKGGTGGTKVGTGVNGTNGGQGFLHFVTWA